MATTDESDTPEDQLSERVSARGWRVIGSPTRRPDPGAGELRESIRSMRGQRRERGRRKADETDPPEAA